MIENLVYRLSIDNYKGLVIRIVRERIWIYLEFYANKKIEELDTRRQKITKAIADLSVETISQQQIDLLSGYLDDWENISFEDKRKATDGLITSISATSEYVKIEWKI